MQQIMSLKSYTVTLLISGLEIRNYSIISNLDANKTNTLDFS